MSIADVMEHVIRFAANVLPDVTAMQSHVLLAAAGVLTLFLPVYVYRQTRKRQKEAAILAEMRRIAPLLSGILRDIGRDLRAGQTTKELDATVEQRLRAAGLEPAMRGYNGFPAASALSIDEEVMHAPPSARVLREGDLVKLQVAARSGLAHVTFGWTYCVGAISDEKRRLLLATRQSLDAGIRAARAGTRLGDIGSAMEAPAMEAGFAVNRVFVGHGIGKTLHQEPRVPCRGVPGTGERLKPGLVLSMNAIVHAGDGASEVQPDGWTAVTEDKRPAALFTALLHIGADKTSLLAALPE